MFNQVQYGQAGIMIQRAQSLSSEIAINNKRTVGRKPDKPNKLRS
ncbi:Uncharacterised protein [Budvicia aquatica]|uniref:Uncharacterized protein n=1 Tax=Budvicia aquatica TaxID=82979 RepID=A0A484ZD03_9GAMM|nr:Uncharacterised protein [Budvicia aquatica]